MVGDEFHLGVRDGKDVGADGWEIGRPDLRSEDGPLSLEFAG